MNACRMVHFLSVVVGLVELRGIELTARMRKIQSIAPQAGPIVGLAQRRSMHGRVC